MKYIIFLALLCSSCCVYKETQTNQDKTTCEIGVAPYRNRPISQDEFLR